MLILSQKLSAPHGASFLQRSRFLLFSACCTIALVAMTGTIESASAAAVEQWGEDAGQRAIYINRTWLSDGWVFALEREYRVRIPDGSYWYDRMSGAWGVEGGPT